MTRMKEAPTRASVSAPGAAGLAPGAPGLLPDAAVAPAAPRLPAGTRLAALAIPATAFAAGLLAPRSRVAALAALWTGAAAAGWTLPLMLAARRPPLPPLTESELPPAGALPRLSVVIPARDESGVIGALIGDLGRQDHRDPDGAPRFDITVIDDRSTDGTGRIASAAIASAGLEDVARVLRRQPGEPDGKGAALAVIPHSELTGDAMVVLDADARIEPSFLRRAASYLARGAPALTARRRMAPLHARPRVVFARAQDDEQTLDAEIQRGRWAMRGGSEFRGDGMVVRVDVLRAAGGWNPLALCEDLELSSRIRASSGQSVVPAIDLVVLEQPVPSLRALWRQRCRWAEGHVLRQIRAARAIASSSELGLVAKADVAAYFTQSLMPIAGLGLLIRIADPRARRLLAVLAAAHGASGIAIGMDALRWSPDAAGRAPGMGNRAARSLAVLALSTVWLAAFPVAWLRVAFGRGPLRFAKTEHERSRPSADGPGSPGQVLAR